MRRLGYTAEAERLADGIIGAVAREGLREYYDPRDGRGMGAKDFAWSGLIAELADPRVNPEPRPDRARSREPSLGRTQGAKGGERTGSA